MMKRRRTRKRRHGRSASTRAVGGAGEDILDNVATDLALEEYQERTLR